MKNALAWDCSNLPQRLREMLADRPPTPRAVFAAMAPRLAYGRHFGPPRWDARSAAVVAALVRRDSDWSVVLTQRPVEMRRHAGQVCFPGGAAETGETAETCAAREWCEELGEAAGGVEFLGRLTPLYVFASNYQVTPCVGLADPPAYDPDPAEVADVAEIRLRELIDPSARGTHWVQRGRLRFRTPHLECRGRRIWGATALMLAELAYLLERLNAHRVPHSSP